uniref:Uncharacterized protein n=1 Tax=Psilocybe cubensis TaxID=181762 RepID=A0A8H7XKT1_PSICU
MDPPAASTSGNSQTGGPVNLGVRKRVDSNPELVVESNTSTNQTKRPRLSSSSLFDLSLDLSLDSDAFSVSSSRPRPRPSAMAIPSSYGRPGSIGFGADRIVSRSISRSSLSLFDTSFEDLSNTSIEYTPSLRLDRPLSRHSSFTGSRHGSPFASREFLPVSDSDDPTVRQMRLAANEIMLPDPLSRYPESSAKHWMRNTRTTIDYTPSAPNQPSARLLGCSVNNFVYFTRGNRVHYKNINVNANEEIGQLMKLKESHGSLRALEVNTTSQPDVIAIGTSKGCIQLWDVKAKKMTASWHSSKEISAMAWNGPILTIGSLKGVIRNYDTRLPHSKIKEQSRKFCRHEGEITTLHWSVDGKYLASGDAIGQVLCWENGLGPPMQVGESVHRRSKKIQQSGKISSVAWCPWQPKVLATGDIRGILRIWNVSENKNSNALPSKLDVKSVMTGIHFSPQCKEVLTTQGPPIGEPMPMDFNNLKPWFENCLAVHSFPSFSTVTTMRLSIDKPIGYSVLDGTGTRLVYQTPSDGKINVCEVCQSERSHPSSRNAEAC